MVKNIFQKARAENLDTIKKMVAKEMPVGAKDHKLRALLCYIGFSRPKVQEYLEILTEASIIELVEGHWRIV